MRVVGCGFLAIADVVVVVVDSVRLARGWVKSRRVLIVLG
jgi:hypothetical protein